MTSQPPPPPPNTPPPSDGTTSPTTGKRPLFRRTWVGWVGGGLIGLFIGIGAGAGTSPDAEDATAAGAEPTPAETVTVTAEPEPAETITVTAEPEPAETVTVTAEPEPAEQPAEDEPAGNGEGTGGTYTAGQWSFTDVQIREDGLDDFEVRARVTNTGGNVEGVLWTVTLFSEGSVVGTASSSGQDIGAGETITATFTTTDDYTDGVDNVEFQVDTQF